MAGVEQVRDLIKQQIESGAITGAIVLVRNNGNVIFHDAQGVADVDPNFVFKTDSVFWIASMTKPIIAVATMMLVEEGKISLDDEVSKYIPAFSKQRMVRTLKPDSPPIPPFPPQGPPDPDAPKPAYDLSPAKAPMTVRHLITMTSGLQTIGVPNDDLSPIDDDDTLATRIPRLADAPLDFEPGTRWHYSNATGFDVLGYIVEVAAGQRLGEFIQQRIFDPLEMKDTSFGLREDLKPRALDQARAPLSLGKYESGSAGMYSTVDDYGKFAQMLLNLGAANRKRFLKLGTIVQMSTNKVGDMFSGMTPREYASRQSGEGKGVGYGLGFGVITDATLSNRKVPTGSFGWDGIGSRRCWIIPRRNTVIVMLTPGEGASEAQIEIEGVVMETVLAH